ncbi:hypothetical protein [Pseudomonas sp. Irchel s3b2]|nr:hypothetical protein [Pseudomonas sp. Irchel s3b2]
MMITDLLGGFDFYCGESFSRQVRAVFLAARLGWLFMAEVLINAYE